MDLSDVQHPLLPLWDCCKLKMTELSHSKPKYGSFNRAVSSTRYWLNIVRIYALHAGRMSFLMLHRGITNNSQQNCPFPGQLGARQYWKQLNAHYLYCPISRTPRWLEQSTIGHISAHCHPSYLSLDFSIYKTFSPANFSFLPQSHSPSKFF